MLGVILVGIILIVICKRNAAYDVYLWYLLI